MLVAPYAVQEALASSRIEGTQATLSDVFAATAVVKRAERLTDVREGHRHALKGTRSRAPEVVDLMLANPVLTPQLVAGRLDMTPQGAVNLLRRLEEIGAPRPDRRGQGIQGRWYADEVLGILEP